MNLQDEANALLTELLTGHGHAAVPYQGWLMVDNTLPILAARVFNERRQGAATLLQLDIQASFGKEEVITESFAGIGRDSQSALQNGFENFAANTLHVFLTAFFGHADAQVSLEDWDIEGVRWRAVIGNFGVRTPHGQSVSIPPDVYPRLAELVGARPLSGQRHWFRLFFSRALDQSDTCEVLFDNQPWPEAEAEIARLSWPPTEDFYSVRCFTVLQRLSNETTDPPSNNETRVAES